MISMVIVLDWMLLKDLKQTNGEESQHVRFSDVSECGNTVFVQLLTVCAENVLFFDIVMWNPTVLEGL